jgi:hypothetical protein
MLPVQHVLRVLLCRPLPGARRTSRDASFMPDEFRQQKLPSLRAVHVFSIGSAIARNPTAR